MKTTKDVIEKLVNLIFSPNWKGNNADKARQELRDNLCWFDSLEKAKKELIKEAQKNNNDEYFIECRNGYFKDDEFYQETQRGLCVTAIFVSKKEIFNLR